ncbi:MAG: NADH-quinone oxidoreductase subunit H [Candidatus Verstraetearchaeota archaeon]|nr:NADH-quinone oxidoreductase subunit H [Candidatus Verstraetearchaeota archaeon]
MIDPIFTIVSLVLIIPIALFLGVIYQYFFRKLSARFQWRVGPMLRMYGDLKPLLGTTRLLQPLYDILKLFGKKTVVPEVSRKKLFVSSPYLSLLFAILAVLFIPFPGMPLLSEAPYSLIIASYLLIASILFTILGPVASGSPWAAIGARREVELFLVSELGFVLSVFSVAIARQTLVIWEISKGEQTLYLALLSVTAGALMLAAMMGKLHIKPFDMPEAEAEIVAGPYTEYSGKLLGTYYLTKVFMLYALVGLFISVFLPPLASSILWLPLYIVAALLILFLLTAVQVLNPRYRIKNAINWYLKVLAILAVVNFVIAVYIWLVL